jgi:hypothetical protein
MEITLEKEVLARVFMHKRAVLGAFIFQEYMDRQEQKGVSLPKGIIEEQAEKFSDFFIEDALKDGTFNDMYEVAWEKLSPMLPEDFCIIR